MMSLSQIKIFLANADAAEKIGFRLMYKGDDMGADEYFERASQLRRKAYANA